MCVVVQMGDQFFNFRNLIFFSLYTLCMCTIEMASICLLFFCKISFYRILSNSFSFCRSFSNGSRKLSRSIRNLFGFGLSATWVTKTFLFFLSRYFAGHIWWTLMWNFVYEAKKLKLFGCLIPSNMYSKPSLIL